MKRGRTFILLAFIMILGLVAVLIVWRFVIAPNQQRAEVQTTPTLAPIEILVVAQPIPKGTQLTEGMLTSVPWQQSSMPQGMFKSSEAGMVANRIVKYDLQANTPLLATMLLSEGEQISDAGSPWALNIPPGMVAVSIPIDRLSAVSYAPRAGDHVDVIASLQFVDVDTDFQSILPNGSGVVIAAGPPDATSGVQNPLTVNIVAGKYGKTIIDTVLGQAVYVFPGETQRPRTVTHMLLQDVIVLKVGDFPLPEQQAAASQSATPTPAPEQAAATPAAPAAPDNITLIVRPQDAVTLNYLMLAKSQLAAQLSLVLRGANDTTRDTTLPVTLGFLLEAYQVPVPAKLPYSLNPRIDALSPIKLPEPLPVQ
jgi:Flp pilus assembly protein CpaB